VGKRLILLLFTHRIPFTVLTSFFRMMSSFIAIVLSNFIKLYLMKRKASIERAICRHIKPQSTT
jgi:hypothetical protein